ncbi:MAG: AAA family ATPase [Thiohalospira sp.]
MVIIVFGLPGTGKTYFSEHLSESIGAVHLNTDKLRIEYDKTGEYDEETKNFIYNQLKNEMVKNIANSNDVIVDGTFHRKENRKAFEVEISRQGVNAFFIEVKAKEETIKQRLKNNRKYSEAGYEVYLKIKQNFDAYEKDHLTLWSDSQDVKDMIKKAKQYIYE